jgi:diadenosine tetraphosphate (Ap4A) HIT family hydrolase
MGTHRAADRGCGPSSCPFCTLPESRIVARSKLSMTIRDGYPVSPGHTLLIPNRHVVDWFDLNAEEVADLLTATRDAKIVLDSELHPDGYNLGVNAGAAAGQTVMHVHLHLIPRFIGDSRDPRGGVRHCIPHRGHYDSTSPPK